MLEQGYNLGYIYVYFIQLYTIDDILYNNVGEVLIKDIV